MDTSTGKFIAHPDKGEVSYLLMVPDQAKAIISLGHGAGAGMLHASMEQIAQRLAENGIASFRYQFPFRERGGGRDRLDVSLATVRNAAKKAHELVPNLPLLAGGHSFGGRMTSLCAAEQEIEHVKGLIFFAFPLHAPGKQSTDRANHLPDITIPMLFLSGTRDALAVLDLFQPLVESLGSIAQLHLLDTANHGYKILKRTRKSEEDVFVEMGRVAGEFVNRIL